MKTSLICTVLNEEATINSFLHSIVKQTKNLEEIIIVDGGSTDGTVKVISNFVSQHKNLKLTLLRKNGNRSIGRNEAIRYAKADIILSTDAGCMLDKDWVKNIIEPFKNTDVDVVAGYYKGYAKTLFQQCLMPYVLIMPDKIDPDNFLPAGRSLAFKKTIWKKVKGFNEKYSHNEDYVFAKDLKKIGARIVFKDNAIVYWIPRDNLRESFYMFFRFAYGDAEAGIFRPKVILLFTRYIIVILFVSFYIISKSTLIINFLFVIFILYVFWAIIKNYKYARHWQAFYILPLIQFTADLAVMIGTVFGIFRLLNNEH